MDSGAHFYRCDFQVHTPRDQNWKGKRCSSDAERMQYAESLIAACRSKNLDAIAITDHHDMAFVPFIRKAALEETDALGNPLPPESKIVVFPGMELTLAVPCQALLLLDADFEDNRFEAVMTALAINPAPPEDAMSAETIRLDNVQSLRGLKEKLDEQSWLRDRYIVFPNVTGEKNNSLTQRHGSKLQGDAMRRWIC